VNTNTPKDTATSVQLFYKYLEENRIENEKKVEEIGRITKELARLIQFPKNISQIQKLVKNNHEILKEFDLSSEKLEEARIIFQK
jgi:mevalonate kinase